MNLENFNPVPSVESSCNIEEKVPSEENKKESKISEKISKLDRQFREISIRLKHEEKKEQKRKLNKLALLSTSPFRTKSTEASREGKVHSNLKKKKKKSSRGGGNGIQLFIDSMKPSFIKSSPDVMKKTNLS